MAKRKKIEGPTKPCPNNCGYTMPVDDQRDKCKRCRSRANQAAYRERRRLAEETLFGPKLSKYIPCPRCERQMFRTSKVDRKVDPWGQVCGRCFRNLTQGTAQGEGWRLEYTQNPNKGPKEAEKQVDEGEKIETKSGKSGKGGKAKKAKKAKPLAS